MRTGAAHAHGLPGWFDPHARRLHGNREMQDLGAFLGLFVDGAGQQQITRRGTTGENLAGMDAIAAFHPFRPARSGQPVRPAAGHQQQPVLDDPEQQGGRGRTQMAEAPCGHRHLMGVHGKPQGCGPAMPPQFRQHGPQFGSVGPAASQFTRDARGQQRRLFQGGGIFLRETVGFVQFSCAQGESPSQGLRRFGKAGRRRSQHRIACHLLSCWVILPPFRN